MINTRKIGPVFGLVAALTIASEATAAADLAEYSLEELMQVVVTSVSKKAQTLAETAAAVYVIQAEDIRRSGATSIPEALRLAPGVQVSAIGNNKWAVSIRGQADRFANKLLVLVDGRSVYTPLFSGVMWEALDIPLENIARIEVIRGPGASVWGANAVNGVINIITQSAFDTQGGQVSVAAGSELRGKAFGRYGWSPDPDTAVQLHAKAHDYGSSKPIGSTTAADTWKSENAGFKFQRLLKSGSLEVQGSVFRSRAGDQLTMLSAPPSITQVRATQDIVGSNLMARWDRQAEGGYTDSLQAYIEHEDYKHAVLAQRRLTFDIEYQQRRRFGESHDLIWGVGYRHSGDSIDSSSMFLVSQRERSTDLYSVYFQDEITLVPEHWRLSLGARLDHNDYTGVEPQPNVRLLWTPDNRNSVWVSAARAVRTPSRMERGAAAYVQADPTGALLGLPSVMQLSSRNLGEERLTGVDLGWRHQFNSRASMDIAAFHYRYDGIRGASLAPPTLMPPTAGFPFGYLLIQTNDNNANAARAHGAEISVDWKATQDWRLQATYAWLSMRAQTGSIPGQFPSDSDGSSPNHQASLRSSLDLSSTVRWDAWLRHVSRIDRYAIPAFTALDMRLAWQPTKSVEVSLVGQNLLDKAHPEYAGQFILSAPVEVQRGAYVALDWKF